MEPADVLASWLRAIGRTEFFFFFFLRLLHGHIIGPEGPDALLWGLRLSGVWLRESNEFKFLSLFLYETLSQHLGLRVKLQRLPLSLPAYSTLKQGDRGATRGEGDISLI